METVVNPGDSRTDPKLPLIKIQIEFTIAV